MEKEKLTKQANKPHEEGYILRSSLENIIDFLEPKEIPERMLLSISELLEGSQWEELNDRFHGNLSFGTGGMRGRTIGKITTNSEKGSGGENAGPEFAAVGTNTLNELTVLRATKGLFDFIKQWMASEGIYEQPRLVVAHDVRHFSEKFSKLTALAWTKLGGLAMVFDGPRSTPQLSYTVRSRYAHAGVVITASHNPFHDNGYKAYFEDGAQLVPPFVDAVVENYKKTSLEELIPWLEKIDSDDEIITLQTSDDLSYRAALEEAVIDQEIIKDNSLKAVFTPIHGTGSISAVPALWDHGVDVCVVDEQNIKDPNFSTVESPNPENQQSLKLGISIAKKTRSDLVMGSDPDCDRIGVAAPDGNGKFHCLSGNQIACMLSEYRLLQLKRKQLLRDENKTGFAILKTLVTSPMLEKIAQTNNVKCINTPTGFKWMAKKLKKYEEKATYEIKQKEGLGLDYDNTDLFTRIEILSKYSTCVALAAEESYGYLPVDLVRDKDGNAAALAIAELFSFIKSSKSTAFDFLDSMYRKYGYHAEKTENIYFEGAEGAETIKRLAKSYRENKPEKIAKIKILEIRDFLKEGKLDEDGESLPLENFLIIKLENGFSVAIRPSGTEPKIKYYIFGAGDPAPTDLTESKKDVDENMVEVGAWLLDDAEKRVKES